MTDLPPNGSVKPNEAIHPYGPSYKWAVVFMLWWISFFNYADRQAIFSVFPLLEQEMQLDKVQLGLLGSAFAWVYGICAPFAGAIVDRVARKTAILGGLHIWSLICVATALSRNFRHLFFFRAAEGLGETFYYPAANSLVSDYHGQATRSRALGLHQTSVYFGTIAGGYFAGFIGQEYGWRWSFVVFGVLGILLGFVLQTFLREPRRGEADRRDAGTVMPPEAGRPLSFLEVATLIGRTPTLLALLAAFMCANFVGMVLLTWMPSYLFDTFGMSLAMAGFSATIYVQLASMIGALAGGVMADGLRRILPGGRMLVQALGVLGGAPFVYLCGQTPSMGSLLWFLAAWGLFKGFYDANIFAAAFDVVPAEARGRVAGFLNMMGWLVGGASAPVAIGYLAESYGLGGAISASAAVYVVAGTLLLLAGLVFVRRDLRRSPSGSRKSPESA